MRRLSRLVSGLSHCLAYAIDRVRQLMQLSDSCFVRLKTPRLSRVRGVSNSGHRVAQVLVQDLPGDIRGPEHWQRLFEGQAPQAVEFNVFFRGRLHRSTYDGRSDPDAQKSPRLNSD